MLLRTTLRVAFIAKPRFWFEECYSYKPSVNSVNNGFNPRRKRSALNHARATRPLDHAELHEAERRRQEDIYKVLPSSIV